MEPVKETTKREFATASALVVFLACWLMSGIGPLSWLGALAPLILAPLFWRRSKGWAVIFAFANPLVLTALLATGSYFLGTAKLHFHGLPGPQSFNLDRQTMLPKIGGGCMIDGSEWLRDGWHNLVLRSCVAGFGPMKGSPSGPYPEEAAISGPWLDAEPVTLADFARGEFPVGAKSRIVPQAARLLEAHAPSVEDRLERLLEVPAGDADDFEVLLQARDFGGGTFAVRIITRYPGSSMETNVLFSGEPAKVVGYFWPRESRSGQQRIPSVRPGT
jgi:hypothetical protein